VLFLRHGAAATYQTAGAARPAASATPTPAAVARRARAQRHGVAWLDLGGIETTHSEGIAHSSSASAAA
jgi:hypothetical protein